MIHLIGVNHAIQHNGFKRRINKDKADEIRDEFKNYILKTIKEEKISYVAEESNPEVLKLLEATSTMAELAAKALKIPYKYVEPETKTRIALEIPAENYEHFSDNEKEKIYRIREKYWFEQIQDVIGSNILFICGPAHIDSFAELLQQKQWQVSILVDYWGKKYVPT